MTSSLSSLPNGISYEVHGAGPVLFLVGAPSGRAGFAPLANELAGRFTVVTHDPRGIGESARIDSSEPTPYTLSEDLGALVDVLTTGPAHFFGASGGAVTLLEFARRRPASVKTLVLHEPPLVRLLGQLDLERRATRAFEMAQKDPQAAAQEFFDLTGAAHRTGPGETPPAHTPLPSLPPEELERNRYFLGSMAGPTVFYEPEVKALAQLRVIVAAGELSHGQLARRAAEALAEILAVELLELPGNHMGPSLDPQGCAARLLAVFEGS